MTKYYYVKSCNNQILLESINVLKAYGFNEYSIKGINDYLAEIDLSKYGKVLIYPSMSGKCVICDEQLFTLQFFSKGGKESREVDFKEQTYIDYISRAGECYEEGYVSLDGSLEHELCSYCSDSFSHDSHKLIIGVKSENDLLVKKNIVSFYYPLMYDYTDCMEAVEGELWLEFVEMKSFVEKIMKDKEREEKIEELEYEGLISVFKGEVDNYRDFNLGKSLSFKNLKRINLEFILWLYMPLGNSPQLVELFIRKTDLYTWKYYFLKENQFILNENTKQFEEVIKE